MTEDSGWKFDNSYTKLPDAFFTRVKPTPVEEPAIAVFNHDLAKDLGLDADNLNSSEGAKVFAGNKIPPGSEPIAQAYSGHQFGHFTMLGDGRAHLLGEHVAPNGERYDIQLKGSGQTPFSRRGDGRAAIGPMLREYIISEAMHALGIPTTRSLAVVTTGEPVFRETALPGAVLTRVARSHIRVGTFEYAAAYAPPESVRTLADYTIARHYPELVSADDKYLKFFEAVSERQAHLIAKWMLVGFIHGVMNTDNMAVSGESIDYGPCAFMDRFSHSTVFSSIDQHGRYAFGNQPQIGAWNLTRFVETLLPLFSANEDEAVAIAEKALGKYIQTFAHAWLKGMRSKLGLTVDHSEDMELIQTLLRLMEAHKSDFTLTFRSLSHDKLPSESLFEDPQFSDWHKRWQARKPDTQLMRSSNPVIIPRNHRVEEALSAATKNEDYSLVKRLVSILKSPFEETEQNREFRGPPASEDSRYQTFCGT